MRLGVCARPEGVAERIRGLEFIEGTVGDILCPREDESVFERRMLAARAAPVPTEAVNCLLPGTLKSTGPDVDEAALGAYLAVVLDRAARLGVRYVVYGSGGSRQVPEGFDRDEAAAQIVSHLKRWGPLAAEAGVVIVLEPLRKAECNIVNTVGEGAELVRRACEPNVRLLADTYHMACDGDPPEAIRDAGELVAHVHCAEGEGRGPLGTNGEDHRTYFRALKDAGYDGSVSIEAKWTDFAAELPAAVAELQRQIDEA